MSKGSQSANTIITDASCFILLDKIECLPILEQLYGQVFTTPEIAAEYGKRLPQWVVVQAVSNRDLLYTYTEKVDIGEASAIALASEVTSPFLIMDDLKGRKLAEQLQLEFTGTLGILIEAKQKALIPSLRFYFEKIEQTDFRISPDFLKILLDKYEKQAK
jgi:predicted nucleic acid-binding protein